MKLRPVLLALFTLGSLVFRPIWIYAEQRELKSETPEKVDAVLLLDASGSMRVTDPHHLREEGAKLFVQFLKPGDRLAIVAFDKVARLIRPLAEYAPAQLDQITKDIESVGDTGEYTDLSAGIKFAVDSLETQIRSDASPVVVLLSDGRMDPAAEAGPAALLTQDLLTNFLPDLKAKGIRIHTLAFSELADKDLLQLIAVGSDGAHWFTPDADKVHQSFADLFVVVKKPQMLPLTSKGFRLDASVDEATFYINREEGGDLKLRSPSGKLITAGTISDDLKWFRGQKFDAITLTKPEAGDWQVEGLPSTEGFATLLTNLKLITDWPSTLNIGSSALLQARLYESDKPIVLPEMSGTTRFAVQILPTDKVSEPILREALFDDGTHGDKIARDGIFSFEVDFNEPGEYKLQIVANAPTFERRQQISFRVKPRVVTLSAIAGSEHGEGHGASPESTHSDSHQATAEHGDAHGAENSEHAADSHSDEVDHKNSGNKIVRGQKFLIELSQDAQGFKNVQIKIVAIDKNRKRYVIAAQQAGDNLTYGAPAAALPHDGEYDVQAQLTAEKKRGHVNEESNKLRFEKVTPAEGELEVELVAVEKKAEPESPILPIILVTLINVAVGAVCFTLLRKTQSSATFTLPEFPALAEEEAVIQHLEILAAQTEVDLKDSRFADEAVSSLPLRGVSNPLANKPGAATARESGESGTEGSGGGEGASPSEAEPREESQPEAAADAAPTEEAAEEEPKES